jgi:hypothetical protein
MSPRARSRSIRRRQCGRSARSRAWLTWRLLIKEVIDAYVARDADKGYAVWKWDAELDELYSSLFRELLTFIMEDPRNISASRIQPSRARPRDQAREQFK